MDAWFEKNPTRRAVAQRLYRRASKRMHDGDYATAERQVRMAWRLAPNIARYGAAVAWAIMLGDARRDLRRDARRARLDEAGDLLEWARTRAPYSASVRYACARYYAETGRVRRHIRELEATLRCDPDHPGARREYARLVGANGELKVRVA